jgi:hypothetical protein
MMPLAQGKTKLLQSWADPSAGQYQFKKLLAVAVIQHPDIRRDAEQAIVRNIRRVKAYPSITILAQGAEKDMEGTKRKLLEAGFDGVVVMRLVNLDNKIQYVAPTLPDPYVNYHSYSMWAFNSMAGPSDMRYKLSLQIETLVYSLTDDKRLYVGVSETTNPESPANLVDQIAKVLGKELQKKGIVK